MHHHYKRSIYKILFRNEFKLLSERYDIEEKEYRTWFSCRSITGRKIILAFYHTEYGNLQEVIIRSGKSWICIQHDGTIRVITNDKNFFRNLNRQNVFYYINELYDEIILHYGIKRSRYLQSKLQEMDVNHAPLF